MPDEPARQKEACRYRFGEFVLSPRRRLLLRYGTPVPIIPRYFDLLLLLVERRDEAIDRREIFDRVWSDVVVSDGALTQAVRTLRRTLGDDSREPLYILTVSRRGYRFVFADVRAEPDVAESAEPAELGRGARLPNTRSTAAPQDETASYEALITRLLGQSAHGTASDEERRDAAEQLHALGTAEALRRLDARPRQGSARARAILRDARWDVPGAGDVPLLQSPAPIPAIGALVSLRLRRATREAANRVLTAAGGGAIAGTAAGITGGTALFLASGASASSDIIPALAAIGLAAGGLGAAGIGAGLAAAEVLARRRRGLGLIALGAVAGLATAVAARMTLQAIFTAVLGHGLAPLGGALEGLVIGGAAGAGYGAGAPSPPGGGMATPHGMARVRAAALTGLACAAAGGILGGAGWRMISVTLDRAAGAYEGSQVGLQPIARAFGEGDLRPITRAVAGAFEGLFFGAGLGAGLTHRPGGHRSR